MKNTSRFLVAGLLIAWLVDFLFFKKPFGIAYTIWMVIAISSLFIVGYLEKIKAHWLSYVLALVAITLSSASFLRMEPFTQTIATLASLFLLMLLAHTFTTGYWPFYRLMDYILQGLKWLLMIFSRSWPIIFQGKKNNLSDNKVEQEPQTGQKKAVWPILRGIILSIPIILILASLLASADPIFEQNLNNFLEIFRIDNLAEYIFRLVFILMLAYVFIGVLVQALYPKNQEPRPQPNQASFNKFLGSTEAKIVLLSVNLLFATFLTIQFRYFFGGETNISETGFTYSEYARRGFGEIITVAVLSLLIYYIFHSITRLETKNQKRWFSVLSILIFLQVLIMLVSSYQRLMLYEQAYGFSRLRTYSHLFLPWLALLIIVVIALEILQRQGHLAFTILLVAVGFVGTTIAFNIDGFIARQNIQRANISDREGYALDFYYISELSSDAVPVILDEYLSNNPSTKDLLGANLSCRWYDHQNQDKRPFLSFNFSNAQSTKLLAQYQQEWKKYPISQGESEYQKIVEIDGEPYYCSLNSMWID